MWLYKQTKKYTTDRGDIVTLTVLLSLVQTKLVIVCRWSIVCVSWVVYKHLSYLSASIHLQKDLFGLGVEYQWRASVGRCRSGSEGDSTDGVEKLFTRRRDLFDSVKTSWLTSVSPSTDHFVSLVCGQFLGGLGGVRDPRSWVDVNFSYLCYLPLCPSPQSFWSSKRGGVVGGGVCVCVCRQVR